MNKIAQPEGYSWGAIGGLLANALPKTVADRDTMGYQLVLKALKQIFGEEEAHWKTFRVQKKDGSKGVLYVTTCME